MNFYRRFIKNCAKIAKPLTELTKNVPFRWTDHTEKAFQELKNAIITAPVLRTFNPEYPIVITTDASKYAIGAVLEQDFPDGRHPIAFISKTLSSSEQNYAPYNVEMLVSRKLWCEQKPKTHRHGLDVNEERPGRGGAN